MKKEFSLEEKSRPSDLVEMVIGTINSIFQYMQKVYANLVELVCR